MMMLGLKFMGEVPFKEVYIHGLVRDERGQKMSKSKGNVIDPLDLIEQYGADALRFTILASTAQGRDIKFGESRVQGYRNFATKLWNATRFCELNGCDLDPAFDPAACTQTVNRWMISKLVRAAAQTGEAFGAYRFNEAASTLYQFTWNEFCDWYLELAKPLLTGEDEAAKAETRKTAGFVLAKLLHLLHPATPFVTEELWERRYGAPGGPLIRADWPVFDQALIDHAAEDELDWLVRTIGAIRTARSEIGVPPGAKMALDVHGAAALTLERIERHRPALERLARLERIAPADGPIGKGALQVVVDEATLVLPLEGVIDLDQEQQRLERELKKVLTDLEKIEKKLANPQFVEKAPEAVVSELRDRRVETLQARDKLAAARDRIAA
jgi:valyl-tRNA synthetase